MDNVRTENARPMNSIPLETNVHDEEDGNVNITPAVNEEPLFNQFVEVVFRQFQFKMPQYPSHYLYLLLLFSGIINVFLDVLYLYLFVVLVILDSNGNIKPWQGVCISDTDIQEHVCGVSIGNLSLGLVAIGSISIGLVSVGQVGIGILFAVGQFAGSCVIGGVGQVATGWYVYGAQVAFALYDVQYCHVGFRFGKCFHITADNEELPVHIPRPFFVCGDSDDLY